MLYPKTQLSLIFGRIIITGLFYNFHKSMARWLETKGNLSGLFQSTVHTMFWKRPGIVLSTVLIKCLQKRYIFNFYPIINNTHSLPLRHSVFLLLILSSLCSMVLHVQRSISLSPSISFSRSNPRRKGLGRLVQKVGFVNV